MSLFNVDAAKSEICTDARAKRANPENESPEISTISTISTGGAANSKNEKVDCLPDIAMEERRQAVLKMLRDQPEITRAWVADGSLDPVRVHLAVRGIGSCELIIQPEKWDPFQFAQLMERHADGAI